MPLEKRPHHLLIICPKLLNHIIHTIFIKDTDHFPFIEKHSSNDLAIKHIINIIKSDTNNLASIKRRNWKSGQAPSAIPLVKAKSEISVDEILINQDEAFTFPVQSLYL